MSSTPLLAACLAALLGLIAIESGPARSRELALVAALAAAAAAGRVLFAFIPNVQPVTVMTAVSGATLGARAGLAVGAGAALLSNAFLGQGPWTPWQMLAWGLVGATAAPLRGLLRHRLGLAAFGVVWGFLFDWILDLWAWSALGTGGTLASYLALAGTGLPFDIAHASGNALLALTVGPTLVRMLERYARRLHTVLVPLEAS